MRAISCSARSVSHKHPAYQVIGVSFIGLEVAASFRAQNSEVSVVGREPCLMEKILGADVENSIRKLHEEHGVTFPTVSSRE